MYKLFSFASVCAFLLWTAGCGSENADGASADTNNQAATSAITAPPAPTRAAPQSQPNKSAPQQSFDEEDDEDEPVKVAQIAAKPIKQQASIKGGFVVAVEPTGTEEESFAPDPQTEPVENPNQPQVAVTSAMMIPKASLPQVRTSGEAVALFAKIMVARIAIRLLQEQPAEEIGQSEEVMEQAQRPNRRRQANYDEDDDDDLDDQGAGKGAGKGSRGPNSPRFGRGRGTFSRGKSEKGGRRERRKASRRQPNRPAKFPRSNDLDNSET